MVDVRERLESAAARPGSDAPLAQVERRLARRRRLRVGGVIAVSVLCLSAIGGTVVLATDGGGGGVSTTRPGSASSRVSATLPEGWVEIQPSIEPTDIRPPAVVLYASQLFAAGTAPVSSVDSCPTDQATTADAFVSIGQLDNNASFDPTTGRPFGERPADFATAPVFSEAGCRSPTNEVTSHQLNYLFSEDGRVIAARVVLGVAAPGSRRAEAYAILNSLMLSDLATPSIPPSVVPPTIPTVPSTVAESPDTEAVRAAFLGWINTQPRDTAGRFVEDWESIKDVVMQAAADAPLPLDGYTGRVDAITSIDGDRAEVIYSFLNGGAVAVGNLRGRAVKVDGEWKVSRDTACAAIEFGGFTCPPRPG